MYINTPHIYIYTYIPQELALQLVTPLLPLLLLVHQEPTHPRVWLLLWDQTRLKIYGKYIRNK